MAMRYDKYCVAHDSDIIGGITEQDLVPNDEVTHEVASGRVVPDFVALTAQKPTGTYTTRRVAQVLGLLNSDLIINRTTMDMYAQKHADGGTRAGASSHRKYTMAKVLAVPQTLRCAHGEDATIQVAATVGYDGTHNPIAFADNQSLPAAARDDIRHTLGQMTLGGVLLNNKTDFSLEFGLTVMAEMADSDIWPTYLSVDQALTIIRLTGVNPLWLAESGAIPLTGQAATHVNTVMYLRKRAAGGTFVANGVAEHIRLTACGLIHPDKIFGAGQRGETGLVLPLVSDGVNAPLTINVTSTIP